MSKSQRKKKNILMKIMAFVMLLLILFAIHLLNYDFENLRYNGLILLIISFIGVVLIRSNKFYVDFGIKVHEIESLKKMDVFKLFNSMHPFIAILNKLNSIAFFVMALISLMMIISSFFE